MRLVSFLPAVLLAMLLCSCGNSSGSLGVPNNVIFYPSTCMTPFRYGVVFMGDTMLVCRIYPSKDTEGVYYVSAGNQAPPKEYHLKGHKLYNYEQYAPTEYRKDLRHVANVIVQDDGSIRFEPSMALDKAKEITKEKNAKMKEAKKKGKHYEWSERERLAQDIVDIFSDDLNECEYLPQPSNAPKMRFYQDVPGTVWKVMMQMGDVYEINEGVDSETIQISHDGKWQSKGSDGYNTYTYSGDVTDDGRLIISKGSITRYDEVLEDGVTSEATAGEEYGKIVDNTIVLNSGIVLRKK